MLTVGSQIRGKLIEEVEKNQWIVSFQGQLLQVKNSTNLTFQQGNILNLKVVSTSPLRLQVIAPASAKNKKHIDVNI